MNRFFLSALLMLAMLTANAAERKIKITKQYLNFPISQQVDRRRMTMSIGDKLLCTFVIRLTAEEPEYWTFQDMSKYRGKTIKLVFDGNQAALDKIYQTDTWEGQANVYKEPYRPRYHFTTQRGWINDPNGLVFADGEAHLFYQHNPFERYWENMHWGHAVSTDLLHWKELPDALHPDTIGTMFSGSAVIDHNNTAGFGTNAMIAYYTADHPLYQRQCMAYSTDGGRTFTKYSGNPVIDSHEKWQSHDTRDPKVFWYAPGKHWVLVLNERDGNSIYNSTNLKDWTFESHITGFWECPELFELPVEGNPDEHHWIMWGASGTYMVGQFDGKTFTPEGPKQLNMLGTGYAAQVFNNKPEGQFGSHPIKMTWARVSFDDMPFNSCMLLPQKQMLHRTRNGLRLYSAPIADVDKLFAPSYKGDDLSIDEANRQLEAYKDNDVLRMQLTIELTYATDASLSYQGQKLIDYDMNGNRLAGQFYVPDEPGSMLLHADVFVDKGVVEVFIDGGALSYSLQRNQHSSDKSGYILRGNQLKIRNLEVFTFKGK